MENYFLLLEIPFDPPESDINKINEAIAKKQAQWSRDLVNPIKKVQASLYLASISDIKKIMLDPISRCEEAAKAVQIKNGQLCELDTRLTLYRAKGNSLSDDDLKLLLNKFSAFGISKDEIVQRFFSGIEDVEETVNSYDVLEKGQVVSLKNLMKQLNMREKTLYDFLELSPTASPKELCEKADLLKKKILNKGEKDGYDNAAQTLCGICAVIFKDESAKRKYDNYVRLTKFTLINDLIDEVVSGAEKTLDPKVKERLIDLAYSQYKLSSADASIYINNYCEYMGYSLFNDKTVCGVCGFVNLPGMTTCIKCGRPLMLPCTVCGGINHNSAKYCAKCGQSLFTSHTNSDLGNVVNNATNNSAVFDLSKVVGYLKSGMYDKALGVIEKAIDDDCGDPDCFFYMAVCLLNGKKAFLQPRPVIDRVISCINSAIDIEPRGVYYYLLAYVKYDYFARKSYNTSPKYDEILSIAKQKGITNNDIAGLFGVLRVDNPFK